MIQSQEKLDWFRTNFELFEKDLNGKSGTPINKIRQSAMTHFSELGLPTIREEEWRNTDVSPVGKTHFVPAPKVAISLSLQKQIEDIASLIPEAPRLVFLNGNFASELSSIGTLPKGTLVSSIAAAIDEQPALIERHLTRYANLSKHPFVALNTAFIKDGGFVFIPKGVAITAPIHLLYVSIVNGQAFVSNPRTLIVAEESSQATVIESYVGLGEGAYFTNPVTEITLGENANVDHYKLQRESEQAYHIAVQQILQGRNSNLTSHSFSFGGDLVRNDINAVLDGEGIECVLNGLYMLAGRQHVDNHTLIDHAQPHCHSRELYKGILDDQSRGVFSGKIHVRKPAQKTDAIQSNKNLVLSENAKIDTKPQLEIFADDVRCTHGGTVGQLDPQGLFYLRARGIGEEEARGIMIQAFAGDVANRVKVPELREQVEKLISARLENRRARLQK
jgi:Fe-S cluster assembly protein SufD